METTFDQRWQGIQQMWRSNAWLFGVFGFVLGMLAQPAVRLINEDIGELLNGLVPETFGIVFTVLIIDRLYRNREQQQRIKTYQAQLVREAGSTVNDIARRAVDDLRKNGWLSLLSEQSLVRAALANADFVNATLTKTVLRRADLSGARLAQANLHQADLTRANLTDAQMQSTDLRAAKMHFANAERAQFGAADLSGADCWHANFTECDMQRAMAAAASFRSANLQGADLSRSNFQSANFESATMQRVNLYNADLRDANLRGADLSDADLSYADLRGADFTGANLRGAAMSFGKRDSNLILPDGTHWQEGDGFIRFTDPDHPDFWQTI